MKRARARLRLKEPDTDINKSVVSTTDCTGLTTTMPRDDAQAKALEDMYNVPLTPQNDPTEKEQKKHQ
jgi:hypothetical protein